MASGPLGPGGAVCFSCLIGDPAACPVHGALARDHVAGRVMLGPDLGEPMRRRPLDQPEPKAPSSEAPSGDVR